MKWSRYILVFIMLVVSAIDSNAQRKREKNKITPETDQKKIEATAKEAKQAQYVATKDHHLKIQDKETRKRMKKTKKKAERHSWGKDVPWYKRWFRRDRF